MHPYETEDFTVAPVDIGSFTGVELAKALTNEAKIQGINNTQIGAIILLPADDDAGIDSISSFISGDPFPNLQELTIKVHVPAVYTDDFANPPKNLSTLQISSKTLTSFPVFHKNLQKLWYLHLGDNKIDSINGSIFKYLENLEVLLLKQNRLTTIGVETFAKLSKLRCLNIADNRIETIQKNAFGHFDKLKILSLSNNRIKEIQSTLNALNMRSLERLRLRHNPVTDVDFVELAKLPNLVELELGSTRPSFENINVSSNSTSFSPLTSLDLSNCNIEYSDHFKGLCYLFPNLKLLELTENPELKKLGIRSKKSLEDYKPETQQ